MMSFLRRFFFVFLYSCLTFLSACSETDSSDRIVVSVDDADLTVAQLVSALPVGVSSQDSAAFADDFIRTWTRRQTLLHKAKQSLSADDDDVEDAVTEYRESLIIERFQKRLIERKFISNISSDDVHDYYNSMKQNFILRDHIIKGLYAVIPVSSPDCDDFLKKLNSFKMDSSFDVEQYLYKYSSNYKLFADTWTTFSSIKKFFPANSIPEDSRSLSQSRFFKYKYDNSVYVLLVLDICPAESIAPIDFVYNDVYNIILGKRKLEFLDGVSRDIYDQAVKDNSIKFYVDND